MRLVLASLLLLANLLLGGRPVFAQQPDSTADEAAIRGVIAAWYDELRKPAGRSHWMLYAPGAIDGGPAETELDPLSRARSPTVSNELAARALQFAFDIDVVKIDPRLAKVIVWERGYFYAFASKVTYENAASAVFVLEKQANGSWLILAHEASSVGIPDSKRTSPLPDLSRIWETRHGSAANFLERLTVPR